MLEERCLRAEEAIQCALVPPPAPPALPVPRNMAGLDQLMRTVLAHWRATDDHAGKWHTAYFAVIDAHEASIPPKSTEQASMDSLCETLCMVNELDHEAIILALGPLRAGFAMRHAELIRDACIECQTTLQFGAMSGDMQDYIESLQRAMLQLRGEFTE